MNLTVFSRFIHSRLGMFSVSNFTDGRKNCANQYHYEFVFIRAYIMFNVIYVRFVQSSFLELTLNRAITTVLVINNCISNKQQSK